MTATLMLLAVAAAGVRWGNAARARLDEKELQFEEAPAPAVLGLGLHRDGVLTVGTEAPQKNPL
jgi:hypothetical protein